MHGQCLGLVSNNEDNFKCRIRPSPLCCFCRHQFLQELSLHAQAQAPVIMDCAWMRLDRYYRTITGTNAKSSQLTESKCFAFSLRAKISDWIFVAALIGLFSKSEDHCSCVHHNCFNEPDLTVSKQVLARIVHSKIVAGNQPIQICATTPSHLCLLDPNETLVCVSISITQTSGELRSWQKEA